MGSFRNLGDESYTCHLMMSGSGKADIFAHDTLRRVHSVAIDCVYKVSSKKDFLNMSELCVIPPYMSGKWLFEIEYSKVKALIKSYKNLFDSDTSCFMFIVDRYADFKEVKEIIERVNDIYTPIIRKDDMFFLFNGMSLSEKVMSFVASSYARDTDSVFTLRDYLLQGEDVNTQRDVVRLIGVSSGNVNSFIMLLLSGKPNTVRGLKKVLKTRVQMGKDLCEAYGVSTFRNFLSSAVYDMVQLKVLYMQGKIYNDIKDLPDSFDEKKLSKYKYQLERIKTEFSYNDIMYLYCKLQEEENKKWYSVADMIKFIYDLYGEVVVNGVVG